MTDPVQEIKQRLAISDVVRDYTALHPGSGSGNFKALCPFHDDHDPSLVVSDAKGFAWCFSCNNGGDIFSFVQKIENCSFPEALRLLSEKAGVKLPDFQGKKSVDDSERAYLIMEEATGFFEKQLAENKKAIAVLAERQLPENILREFRVGFAPDADHALEKYLLEKGYSRKEMLDTGLVVTEDRQGGVVRDKFRNRIMFPIWNSRGNICAFGGRYIGSSDKAPKYLNSPDTKIYKKSDVLYGFFKAKEAIRQEKTVVIVEGYFDVLACVAAGIRNAIAISGTAFAKEHAKLLSRSAKTIALAFDIDQAGQTASRRAAEIAYRCQLDVEVISIPGGKDPDEAIRGNKQEFLLAVAERKPGMEAFIFRAFLHRNRDDIADKKLILDELLPVLMTIPREIEQEHYARIIAEKIGSRPEVIERELRLHRNSTMYPEKRPTLLPKQKKVTLTEYLFGMILGFPELFPESRKHLLADLLSVDEKRFYKLLEQHYNEVGSLLPETILPTIPDDESQKWRALALYAEDKLANLPSSLTIKELLTTIRKINLQLIPTRLTELSVMLKNDKASSAETIIQMNELTKLLNKFHHS